MLRISLALRSLDHKVVKWNITWINYEVQLVNMIVQAKHCQEAELNCSEGIAETMWNQMSLKYTDLSQVYGQKSRIEVRMNNEKI